MNRRDRAPIRIEIPWRSTVHAWAMALFGVVMVLATAWWLSPSSDQLLPNPRGPETHSLSWPLALPLGIAFGTMCAYLTFGAVLRLARTRPALALSDGRLTIHTATTCTTFPLVRVIQIDIVPRKKVLSEPFLMIRLAGWTQNFGLVPRRRFLVGEHELTCSVEQAAQLLSKARDPLPTISRDGNTEGPAHPRGHQAAAD